MALTTGVPIWHLRVKPLNLFSDIQVHLTLISASTWVRTKTLQCSWLFFFIYSLGILLKVSFYLKRISGRCVCTLLISFQSCFIKGQKNRVVIENFLPSACGRSERSRHGGGVKKHEQDTCLLTNKMKAFC